MLELEKMVDFIGTEVEGVTTGRLNRHELTRMIDALKPAVAAIKRGKTSMGSEGRGESRRKLAKRQN